MIVPGKGKEKIKRNKTIIVIDGTNPMFVTVVIITITIIIIVTIIILSPEKNYKYTSAFWSLNPEGKQKWNILKNHQDLNSKELEDWGPYWIIQQNIDDNSSAFPVVTCQRYCYTWFVTCIRWTDTYYVPPKKEKKKMVMF
jgi:hypothetical protein